MVVHGGKNNGKDDDNGDEKNGNEKGDAKCGNDSRSSDDVDGVDGNDGDGNKSDEDDGTLCACICSGDSGRNGDGGGDTDDEDDEGGDTEGVAKGDDAGGGGDGGGEGDGTGGGDDGGGGGGEKERPASDGGGGGADGDGEEDHDDAAPCPLPTHKQPDGGWGWVVALAAAVIMMVVPVMGPCFGVLFSRYLLESRASSATTAWIFNVQCFLWNVSALFCMPLTKEFGWRRVGMSGAFVASLGFMLCAFSPAPEFLFFSYSVLCGIGGGIVFTVCFFIVPLYFDRYRGTSNMIMHAGVGAGQILAPHFARWLQDHYGYKGATLIFGAVMLHSCVAAALFQPVEWHLKPRKPVEKAEVEEGTRLISKIGSIMTKTKRRKKTTKSSFLGMFGRVASSTLTDLSILKSPRACIICFGATLCLNSTLNFIMMVPFAVQDAGQSLDFAAWCLSVKAMCDLATRLVVSPLADWSRFSVQGCYMIGFALASLTTFMFPMVHSRPWLLVTMAVYGCGIGANLSIHTLVMISVMGMERMPAVFGTSCFMTAFGFIAFGPVIGWIQDAWRSYQVSMWILGSMMGVCVLLWLLMGRARRYDHRQKPTSEERQP